VRGRFGAALFSEDVLSLTLVLSGLVSSPVSVTTSGVDGASADFERLCLTSLQAHMQVTFLVFSGRSRRVELWEGERCF